MGDESSSVVAIHSQGNALGNAKDVIDNYPRLFAIRWFVASTPAPKVRFNLAWGNAPGVFWCNLMCDKSSLVVAIHSQVVALGNAKDIIDLPTIICDSLVCCINPAPKVRFNLAWGIAPGVHWCNF
jgi:hypothetical protein